MFEHKVSLLDDFAHSKVAQLYNRIVSADVEQEIVELDVPMDDPLSMAVVDSGHSLLEKVSSHILTETPPSSYICEKITASTKLHHKH